MKTLTALAAVAALVAGISIASAASMDKSSTMGSSSASVTGTGKFCIKGAAGALNCQYASLSGCKKNVKSGETCQARPSSTTGSKY